MSRKLKHTYDPSKGTWSTTISSTDDKSKKKTKNTKNTNNRDSNLSSSDSDKKNSKGKVEKKYNNIEVRTLEGSLSYIADEKTFKLRVGDTVRIVGIGKYLSGNYYVKEIERTLNSNGYSHSATVIRTNFGSKLKIATVTKKKGKIKTTKNSKSNSKKVSSSSKASSSNKRKYTVKKGDSVYSISKKFYGNGNSYSRIFDSNGNQISQKSLRVGQVLTIS